MNGTITNMQINHQTDPLGIRLSSIHFSWLTEGVSGAYPTEMHVTVWEEQTEDGKGEKGYLCESGPLQDFYWDTDSTALELRPRTRYFWQVFLKTDTGEEILSDPVWFETGKMDEPWQADWLLLPEGIPSAVVSRKICPEKAVRKARLYLCGLGLYEVWADGRKAGDEYLMPGYQNYDLALEYQTLDLTDAVKNGARGLQILLGNGWYKGRFLFDGGMENIYGNRHKVIAELYLTYEDGTEECIRTDESWSAETSMIGENSIYDGELQDESLAGKVLELSVSGEGKELLTERTSVPVIETERLPVAEIIRTPKGETVLDFGEMITGWVEFTCREPEGNKVYLQYGELLQEGNFYRENLRTAKAEFTCISTGREEIVRPHFTFYGFRYVKVEGVEDVRPDDFTAVRIGSRCDAAGSLETGHALVNRLIKNAFASQRCNFLDVPTDCPQRDERMGWTGDIGIFADTACFFADCAGFLDHYLEMMKREQDVAGGAVPFFVPKPKIQGENLNPFFVLNPVCAWGDAATVIPWALYEHTCDRAQLRRMYPAMKHWTLYEKSRAMENQIPGLWQQDIQLGDWLALDATDENGFFGQTDTGLIASAYYYHSTELTMKAAKILGEEEDARLWQEDMERTKTAFQEAFFDADGGLRVRETQTTYAVVLAFGLCPEKWIRPMAHRLAQLIQENGDHLNTGFVGTPLLAQVLSDNGEHETACRLFLNEEYPGWLKEVKLGAVSIWERWNSLDENGQITGIGMNSMNHYAYGSICAWIFRTLCGFCVEADREKMLTIRPRVCRELGYLSGSCRTAWGVYRSSWEVLPSGEVQYEIEVPFGGKAEFVKENGETVLCEAGTSRFA